ncbi:MAG: hypothetical protein ACR2NG_07300 [Acidimicrobiia bacterium]
MTAAKIIGGLVVSFAGLVWTLQGLGSELAPQSFMTDNKLWILIGAVTMVGGAVIAWRSWSNRG